MMKKKIITAAEKTVLNELGIDNKSFAALSFKLSKFCKKVNSYLNKHYKWEGVYKQYKIIFLEKPYLMETLNENEILINKLILNEKVIEAVYKLAEDLYKAQKEKLDMAYNDAIDKLKQEDDIWVEIEPMDKESVKKDIRFLHIRTVLLRCKKCCRKSFLKLTKITRWNNN